MNRSSYNSGFKKPIEIDYRLYTQWKLKDDNNIRILHSPIWITSWSKDGTLVRFRYDGVQGETEDCMTPGFLKSMYEGVK